MLLVTECRVTGEEGWQTLLDDRKTGKERDGEELDRRGTERASWKEGVCFNPKLTDHRLEPFFLGFSGVCLCFLPQAKKKSPRNKCVNLLLDQIRI